MGSATAAPDEAWYLHSSFQQIHARAMIDSATTLGGDYDRLLRSGKMANALESAFEACARRHPTAIAGDYMVVGFVLRDGRMADAQVSPANDLAVCFGRAVDGLVFPSPPARHVPFPVASKFDGRTLKQVSRYPPTDRPPGPPS
jgi:hypothetical protein